MPTRTQPPGAVSFGATSAVADRTFARNGRPETPTVAWLVDGLTARLAAAGYEAREEPGPDVQVVLHAVDGQAPRPYRRKNAPTFVVAIVSVPASVTDVLRAGYPVLVRALANLAVLVSEDGAAAHFVTLEQGTYTVEHDGDDAAFFAAVLERVEPLASSRLVIANEFRPDLEPELWSGDRETAQLTRAGERLAELDLLPSVFPIEEILSERELRHVKLLYGIGGLSYGNLSARRRPPADSGLGPEFWMSASGVDKSKLRAVGREVLLVRGYDPVRDAIDSGRPTRRHPEPRVGRRDRALDDLPGASRGRGHRPRPRVDPRHHRDRDQLPVRHRRARPRRRRRGAPCPRPDAGDRRAAQPRPHDHRP